MKIKIGNQVFQGQGVELAKKVIKYKIPKGAKTIAIIGEDDQGDKCFAAAVDADELPYALNELWDMLQPVEEPDCDNCAHKDECPGPELHKLFSELEAFLEEI
jgi:hypothetical protein